MITDTKDRIRQMIEFDGSLTNVQLARALGISRQAVSKHARGMFLNRSANPNRSCIGCGRRVKKLLINRSRMCRSCRRKSFEYEVKCAQCGKITEVNGANARARRYRQRNYPDGKEFCNLSCRGRYYAKRRWAILKLSDEVKKS